MASPGTVRPARGLVTMAEPSCGRIHPWIARRSSCCAPSRSATSGSSGCGSPTSSGTLKSRGGRPGRTRGCVHRGHRLRRPRDRGLRPGLRGGHAGQARPVDVPGACRGGATRPAPRGCSATCSMPDGSPSFADPRQVLRRALSRAGELGFTFYTHPEIEFFLLKRRPEAGPGPSRSTTPATSTTSRTASRHDFRRAAITMLEAMGISVEFSHHEGAPGPERDRPALRRRADDGRQHHDVQDGHQGGRARAGHLRDVHAQAVRGSPGLRDAHPPSASSRATRNAFYEAGAPYQLSKVGTAVRRRTAPARRRDHRGDATSGSTPTSGCGAAARRPSTSPGVTTTAPR